MSTEKKFWQGTNFWVASIMVALGLSTVAISEDIVRSAVLGVSGLVSTVFLVREKLKDAKISVRQWLLDANTWYYGQIAILAAFPKISPEIFTRISELVAAIFGGNWQGVVQAGLGLLLILYKLFKKPVTPAAQ